MTMTHIAQPLDLLTGPADGIAFDDGSLACSWQPTPEDLAIAARIVRPLGYGYGRIGPVEARILAECDDIEARIAGVTR
jgi:hypothetical protein